VNLDKGMLNIDQDKTDLPGMGQMGDCCAKQQGVSKMNESQTVAGAFVGGRCSKEKNWRTWSRFQNPSTPAQGGTGASVY